MNDLADEANDNTEMFLQRAINSKRTTSEESDSIWRKIEEFEKQQQEKQ